MADNLKVEELDQVVVRFSGDSGDGMQLAGNIFSTISATVGNGICTFPDYPADIRAPQGSLTGVSGFQVSIASDKAFTPGDKCDVLVAMNPAALKTQYKFCKPTSSIIIDVDSFKKADLEKAQFEATDAAGAIAEMGIKQDVIEVPVTSMVKDVLADSGMDPKAMLKCRNMLALGLVCYIFNRDLSIAEKFLRDKFSGKKAAIAENNIKVIHAGYDFGANTHASVSHTYNVVSKQTPAKKGRYMDINGNKATAYGLIAAAEKAGLRLYLGSYPITPATDVLHELSKHKSLGVTTVQCEDEIAGCASALGASFAGALGVTSTSGPGICLKSEAMNLAVIMELPLVVIDVQRGGPATGLPTKSEQTDLLQVLFGRNGETPMPVIAATSPADCFESAYAACKIALEHMTPVVFMSDAYIANGSEAFKLPNLAEYPAINIPYVPESMKGTWTPYMRDERDVRYWAVPGREGFAHILGGLEKDSKTGAISTNPENHDLMCRLRQSKIDKIPVPDVEVEGDKDNADLLIVGFGGTYGHLHAAMDEMRAAGKKVALAHFRYINPLPKNTAEVLKKYKKVVVAEQNLGQFAAFLRMKVDGFAPAQFNEVKGQPFVVSELVAAFNKLI
ncbi:MAG: 2-oxoacid:acceptor oxidoreductase subunit alpha [Paludibacteraceae bacterium]|jgi:2-oxoglutarate ferredoxin oxidoreductase subunit alpha|nr:2-oxoacid:acceptor oxidoreductase subunit alpha [Paludibacteraceae bacterium]